MDLGGGGDSKWTFSSIMMAIVIMTALPLAINLFTDVTVEDETDQLISDYRSFTGQGRTNEAVWCLTGIYTPYTGSTFGYTEDGWLYGTQINSYSPSQIPAADPTSYTVSYQDGFYKYSAITDQSYGGHEVGDLYSAVSMDRTQRSTVFFTEQGRQQDGQFFYYDYTGYRYAFQPMANYEAQNGDGKVIPIVAKTTSLSLIWYQFYTAQGISGNLILTGNDAGLSYIGASEIIRAFDNTTSTATFNMRFNGLDMHIYIRMIPYYLNEYSISEAFNQGYWEVMVSSPSTDSRAYTNPGNSFNIYGIIDTIISLFTFNLDGYGFSGISTLLAGLFFVTPLYAMLLTIGLHNQIVLAITGILAVFQTIAAAIANWGFW